MYCTKCGKELPEGALVIDSIIVGFATTMVLIAVFFPWFLANPFGFFNWLSFPFAMGLI